MPKKARKLIRERVIFIFPFDMFDSRKIIANTKNVNANATA